MFIRLTDEKWANDDKQFVLDLLHEEHVLLSTEVASHQKRERVIFVLFTLLMKDTLNIAFDRIDSFLIRHRTAKKS